MLEGQANLTTLDLQISKLREAALQNLSQTASHMREKAMDVKATVTDIEDWLDRIKQLAQEVRERVLYLIQWLSYWGQGPLIGPQICVFSAGGPLC